MKTLLSEDELLALAYPTVTLEHDGCEECAALVAGARRFGHVSGRRDSTAFHAPLDGHSATVRRVSTTDAPSALFDRHNYDDHITRVRIWSELNNDGLWWNVDGVNTATLPWRCTVEMEYYSTFERAVAAAQTFCERQGYTLMPPSCQRGAHVYDDAGGDTCMQCGYVFDDSDLAAC